MRNLLQRLKGLAGMTGLWVTISVPLGLASDAVRILLRGGAYDFANVQYLLDSSLAWALQGFATGLIFAVLISVTERQRDASRISTLRSILNGFVAGGLGALGGFLLLTGNTFTGTVAELVASLTPFMFASGLIGATAGFGVAALARDPTGASTEGDASSGTFPMPAGIVQDASRDRAEARTTWSVVLLGFLASGAGCSPETADQQPGISVSDSAGIRVVQLPSATPQDSITLQELWRHGRGAEDYAFSNIRGATVLPDGSVVAVDGVNREIVSIRDGGRSFTLLARSGEGPTEVGAPRQLVRAKANGVWVEDVGNGRLMLFSGDSIRQSISGLANPSVSARLMPIGMGQAGELLMTTASFSPRFEEDWLSGTLARFDPTSLSFDSVGSYPMVPKLGEEPWSPFRPFGHVTVAGGAFIVARSDRPELTWITPRGQTTQITRWTSLPRYPTGRDWEEFVRAASERTRELNRSAPQGQLEQLIEASMQRYELDESQPFPVMGPIFGGSDGSVWIPDYESANQAPERYRVMGAEGIWIGVVRFSRPFTILDASSHTVLGREVDDLGVESLVAYELGF